MYVGSFREDRSPSQEPEDEVAAESQEPEDQVAAEEEEEGQLGLVHYCRSRLVVLSSSSSRD